MTREEFETKFAVLCLGGDFKKHKELKALVHTFFEQLEKQIPRWRSVEKDGLPEKSGPCFIYSPRWQSVGAHCLEDAAVSNWNAKSGRWEEPFDVVWLPSEVTHWLPLSDLPEPIGE